MMDPADRARNLANWEGRVPIHAGSEGYGLDRYVDDPDRLSDVVAADAPHLGDLTGLDVVHLQCHIGTDTISLARLGGDVSGVDFSPAALEVARDLSERTGTPATFLEADVHDAVAAVGHQVDVVYTSIGTLCWLPSVARWAEVVAGLLKPGGRLYLRDAHPMLMCVDETRDDGLLVLGAFPYFERAGAQHLDEATTYAGDGEVEASETVEWAHGLAEIVQAVLDVGLQVTRLHEGDTLDWCFAPWMEQVEPGVDRWRLPTHHRDLCPVEFTLEAVRPG